MKIGSIIKFTVPNRDRRSGGPLVKGMTGTVRKVVPADSTINPQGGDHLEAVFQAPYGGSFGAWVRASEIEVISNG